MSVDHYENFPVASVLCPPAIRPAVVAIYRFARTADDMADEGDAAAHERLAALSAYRQDLQAILAGGTASAQWTDVFEPLRSITCKYQLPGHLLNDLLDAFAQDVGNPVYADRAELLGYCCRSANPVGRLLLHLYAVRDDVSLQQSDAICSALQLINFWQDLSVDLPRGRIYVPLADAARHGLTLAALQAQAPAPESRALVADLCAWAEQLMRQGAPLAWRLPGRLGWELRLVVLGGLRILEKIRRMNYASLQVRPVVGRRDVPVLLWRALTTRPGDKP